MAIVIILTVKNILLLTVKYGWWSSEEFHWKNKIKILLWGFFFFLRYVVVIMDKFSFPIDSHFCLNVVITRGKWTEKNFLGISEFWIKILGLSSHTDNYFSCFSFQCLVVCPSTVSFNQLISNFAFSLILKKSEL